MFEIIETADGFKAGDQIEVTVMQDEFCDNPREWDNVTRMICFHRRYNLGDPHSYKASDYAGWDALEEAITKAEHSVISMPLYLYNHSGLTISTSPFSCPWDSGQVGFVLIRRSDALSALGVKRLVMKRHRKRLLSFIEGEVQAYDQYLRGDVYEITLTVNGECRDSLGSLFGLDYATKQAREMLEGYLKSQEQGGG